jgi:acetoacetyl-CoA synthetase
MDKPKILWQPSENFINQSNLKHYEQWLAQHKNLYFENYQALWEWSTDAVEDFWESLWCYFDIIAHSPYQKVLSSYDMPGAVWFEGATLNYAEHIFRRKNDERPAILFQNETSQKTIEWDRLSLEVQAVQQYLQALGVGKNDRVVAYLPNIPEATVCFLAVNALGAIWSCCAPDFGVETVVERLAQIDPCVFIAVDGYQYNGKPYSRLEEVGQIRTKLANIRQTLFIPYLNPNATLPNAVMWDTVISSVQPEIPLKFVAVPFDHPIWVLYSSGTTGKPKAITHSHGGVLLEHLKYMTFHNDVHVGDNFFWFTTTGWMMWNFLQASLLVGATAVLFDGSPTYPSINVLWEMAAKLPIHHFGTSAPFLTACMKQALKPNHQLDFSALRTIGSTGSPLPPETFEWVYEAISDNIWLCSMSGGTDVCTAFVGGIPYLPVQKGMIQGVVLGCALFAYSESGERLSGVLGEMVIEKPMPSMPIYFWNDVDNSRYRSSYFDVFPNKWRHGDWIRIADDGALIIQGRSDATLNRKGVRIGTAEIYNVLDKIYTIKDSLVLNLELENGDDVMPLFLVLQDGVALDDALQHTIRQSLKTQCSPRHVPDIIFAVPDIPYTLSGKKMEVPIKKIFMNMEYPISTNREAVRNPEAIDYFVALSKVVSLLK